MKINFTKYLAALAAFVLCLLSSAANTKAAITADNITVDYDKTCLVVNAGNEKQILFGVSQINKNNVITTPSWNIYDVPAQGGEVTIDLSFLKRTKDTYIQVKGNSNDEPVTLCTLAMQKLKLKINSVTKELVAKSNTALEGLEYRTIYSGLQKLSASANDAACYPVPDMYWQRGAVLYVRASASKGKQLLSGHGIKDTDGKDISIYSIGRFRGKEVKVNVPKLKNGPKIAADWSKCTVTIPAKSEYRIKLSNQNQYGNWVDAGNKKLVLNEVALADLIKNGGIIEARVKATSKNAASKVSMLNTVGYNGKNLEAVYMPDGYMDGMDPYWTNAYNSVTKWNGLDADTLYGLQSLGVSIDKISRVRIGAPVSTENGIPVIYRGMEMRDLEYFWTRADVGGFTAWFVNLSDVDSYQVVVETLGYNDYLNIGRPKDWNKPEMPLQKFNTKTYTLKPKARKKITISLSLWEKHYRVKRMKIRLVGTNKNKSWPSEYFEIGFLDNSDSE